MNQSPDETGGPKTLKFVPEPKSSEYSMTVVKISVSATWRRNAATAKLELSRFLAQTGGARALGPRQVVEDVEAYRPGTFLRKRSR